MLKDTHIHDGSFEGGEKLHIRNIVDANRYLFLTPGDFEESSGAVAITIASTRAVLSFSDGSTGQCYASFMVPPHKKAISSIKVFYYRSFTNRNLVLTFTTRVDRLNATSLSDTSGSGTYNSGTTGGELQYIEVPKSAWDGLLGLKPFDIINFSITRSGGSGSDTYNSAWPVLGVLVEFS